MDGMNGVRVKSWPAKVVDTLEPARSCVVSCARSATCNARPKRGKAEAHFCNWAMQGFLVKLYNGLYFYAMARLLSPPPSFTGKIALCPTNERDWSSVFIGISRKL